MGRSERIVDIQLLAFDEPVDEAGIVGLFARVESKILE